MRRLLLVVLIGAAFTSGAAGRQPDEFSRIGLVLSGGGAKGLAHVGVINVLEEAGIPIDVIAGTSMGAIVGGLYAAGYSAADLEAIVTGRDWSPLFSDAVERREQSLEQRIASEWLLISIPVRNFRPLIPDGLVVGQEAMMLLSRLSWNYHDLENLGQLPIPFVAVATDLTTGQATALDQVTFAQAIRASMSLPSIFSPARIGSDRYLDGGMSRNLPATEALDRGADYLIGVDVADLPDSVSFVGASLVDVLVHASWYQGYASDIEERKKIDFLIRPDIQGLSATKFDDAKAWIERGEAAARAALPTLRAARDSMRIPPRPRPEPLAAPKPRAVHAMEVSGVDDVARRLVLKRLGLEPPMVLGPDDIERAIARVYASGLFELVTYRLLPEQDGFRLLIEVVPQAAPDRIRLGMRHDTRFRTQILTALTLRNRWRYGSTAELRWRIGEQSEIHGSYFTRLGNETGINVGGTAGLAAAPVRVYYPDRLARALGADPNIPVLGLRMDVWSGEMFAGYLLSESALIGLSARTEYVHVTRQVAGIIPTDPPVAPTLDLESDYGVFTFGGYFLADTFDRRSYPREGSRLSVDVRGGFTTADPLVVAGPSGGDRWLRLARIKAERVLPVTRHVSLFGQAAYSFGKGEALPLSHYSFLGGEFPISVLPGGFLPLIGARNDERFGRKAWMGLAGLQWEVNPGLFMRVAGNLGSTYDVFVDREREVFGEELAALLDEKPILGFGVELGVRTALGPIRVLFSSDDPGRLPETSISLGHAF